MIWTLVQKTVASLDQRFENAQDKLLESLIGTKKVLFPTFPRCAVRWNLLKGRTSLSTHVTGVSAACVFATLTASIVVPVSASLQSCTPRWQTCIENTDDTLGFALGALFVKATFDKKSKDIVSTMIYLPNQRRERVALV